MIYTAFQIAQHRYLAVVSNACLTSLSECKASEST